MEKDEDCSLRPSEDDIRFDGVCLCVSSLQNLAPFRKRQYQVASPSFSSSDERSHISGLKLSRYSFKICFDLPSI